MLKCGYGNPFTPGFGEMPYVLAGRDDIINDYEKIIESHGRSQEKHPVIQGARSFGKTVLLQKLIEVAQSHGYITFYESASRDLYANVMTLMRAATSKLRISSTFELCPSIEINDASTGTSTSIKGFTLSRTVEDEHIDKNLELLVNDLIASKKVNGIVVAIDEINIEYIEDIQVIASTMQKLVAEKLPVSFIGAGLPEYIDEIKQNKSISFIRRMSPKEIGGIMFNDLTNAIKKTCNDHDIDIDDDAVDCIVRASDGSPYLTQVFSSVSYDHAESRTKNGNIHITIDDCLESFHSALPTIMMCLVKPTLKSVSAVEQEFLEAMSVDVNTSASSNISDIVSRMGKTPQYVNIYRKRLIEKRIIAADRRGKIKCIIPYLLVYLSNQEKYDAICHPSDAYVDFNNRPDFWI